MSPRPDDQPDAYLPASGEGPPSGSGEIFLLLYGELKALAQSQLAGERDGHTLNATALVHEAYLKLSGSQRSPWQSDAHFCAVAAQAMRRVLVDHARARGRLKRGGGAKRTELTGIAAPEDIRSIDVLALDEALTRLSAEEPVAARVVEMRFFAGLQEKLIGEALGVTERTVRRHWTFAKAWLYRELSRTDDPTGDDGAATI